MVCLLPFKGFLMVMLLPDMHFNIKTFNQSHFSHCLLLGRVKVKEVAGGFHTF